MHQVKLAPAAKLERSAFRLGYNSGRMRRAPSRLMECRASYRDGYKLGYKMSLAMDDRCDWFEEIL